jgi:TonB family protein
MKVCPQCNAEFEDNINFCLNDGSSLSAPPQRDVKTENFSAPLVDGPASQPQETVGYTPPPTESKEERTVAQSPIIPPRSIPARSRSKTILFIVLGICALGIIVVVLGVAGVLYYLVYQQPAVARTNTNSIVLSNVNSTTTDSNLSSTNTIEPSQDTNSSLPSNSLPGPISNNNTPANRKATPTPLRSTNSATIPRNEDASVDEPPPPPAPKPLPKTISAGVLNGKAISLPKPAYPPAARAVRAGGTVQVSVLIDETGRVISAHAVGGNPLLISAAESAARAARFSPTLLSGQPVKVSGIITYNFVP